MQRFFYSPFPERTAEVDGWYTTKHSRSFATSFNLATIHSQLQMPLYPVKEIFSASLQSAEVNLSLDPVHILGATTTTDIKAISLI